MRRTLSTSSRGLILVGLCSSVLVGWVGPALATLAGRLDPLHGTTFFFVGVFVPVYFCVHLLRRWGATAADRPT